MRKWLIGLLTVMAGCTPPNPNPEPEPDYTWMVSGVEVRVVNNVAPCLDINATTGYKAKCVGVGNSRLVRGNYRGGPRRIAITVVATTEDGKYLGSDTREFTIPKRGETKLDTWEVNYVRKPRYGALIDELLAWLAE